MRMIHIGHNKWVNADYIEAAWQAAGSTSVHLRLASGETELIDTEIGIKVLEAAFSVKFVR